MRGWRALVVMVAVSVSCDRPTAPSTADLTLSVRGLPDSVPFRVVLVDGSGDSIVATAGGVLSDLAAGRYLVRASAASVAPDRIRPPAPRDVRLVGGEPLTLVLDFVWETGGLIVKGANLPDDLPTPVRMRAPDGTMHEIMVPSENRGLTAGDWTIMPGPFERGPSSWNYAPAGVLTIEGGPVSRELVINFTLTTSALDVRFIDFPAHVPKRARIVHGFLPDTLEIFGDTLVRARPGWSWIHGVTFDAFPYRYASTTDGVISHPRSSRPVVTTVQPQPPSGALRFDLSGLPAGAASTARLRSLYRGATVDVPVRGDTVPYLAPDTYELDARAFLDGGVVLQAAALDTIEIRSESLTTVPVTYAPASGTFDARIAQVHLSQAVQTFAGDVPLIPGRPALLRVFLQASRSNTLRPTIRVRLLDGAVTLLDSLVPSAMTAGIPTTPAEGEWAAVTLRVPGELIRAGVRVEADLDPDDRFTDSSSANDRWPRDGATGEVDVREVPPLTVRLIPVWFAGMPTDVAISPALAAQLLDETYAALPLQQLDFDVRAPYVTSSRRPTALDGEGWARILAEVEALRMLEGGARHYVGMMGVDYTAGIAGIGYLPGRSVLVWNQLASAAPIIAHELGHNFGRAHAPCGLSGGSADPRYPFADGRIGDLGWDARTDRVLPASTPDLMSYCEPAWTSAFTYSGVLAHRDTATFPSASHATLDETDVMLVSGSITGGRVTLDPVFTTRGVTPPSTNGPHRLTLRDESGGAIVSLRFASSALSEGLPGVEHFALAIPLARLAGRVPAAVVAEAAGGGREERRARGTPGLAGSVTLEDAPDGRVGVRWTGPGAAGFIVRDAESGRILSITRSPYAVLPYRAAGYEVTVSDGLRSVTQRVRPAAR